MLALNLVLQMQHGKVGKSVVGVISSRMSGVEPPWSGHFHCSVICCFLVSELHSSCLWQRALHDVMAHFSGWYPLKPVKQMLHFLFLLGEEFIVALGPGFGCMSPANISMRWE